MFIECSPQELTIVEAVVSQRSLAYYVANHIWDNPETGYKEWNTQKFLTGIINELGFSITEIGDIPGFYFDINFSKPGPKIALLAEMDSVICPNHPAANKTTGAVHACGHHIQCAALIGIAAVLSEENIFASLYKELCGSIRIMFVPAEEMIEVDFRKSLRDKGIIQFLNGKPELIRRGYFDKIDIAVLVHTAFNGTDHFYLNLGANGSLIKEVQFLGRSTHAAYSPQNGINALYAANNALNAINALRETWIESDCARVHSIIKQGGDVTSTIPEKIVLEMGVRGSSVESIMRINRQVNRAIAGAAVSIGAKANIEDFIGYLPLQNDKKLANLSKEVMGKVVPKDNVQIRLSEWEMSSTDMGDVSSLIPSIHPHCGGAVGNSHGSDYNIGNFDSACINSAKYQILLAYNLLLNNAINARQIMDNYVPVFKSKEEYCNTLVATNMSRQVITYNDNGSIILF